MTLMSMEALEALRVDGAETYAERKARCEQAISEWIWATGPLHSLAPLEAERGGWGRGRRCPTIPDDVAKKFEHGFDGDNRLRLIRAHSEFPGCADETFIDWGQGFAWCYGYRDHKTPKSITQIIHDDGQVTALALKTRYGQSVERFRWTGPKRPCSIEVESDLGVLSQYEVRYRGGLVSEIVLVHAERPPHLVYKAKPPKLRPLLEQMGKLLPDAIIDCLKRSDNQPHAYGLILSYSDASKEEMALPVICIGLEDERARWRAEQQSPEALWNPSGLSTYGRDDLEITDETVAELAHDIALALATPKHYRDVKKMYLMVARDLIARGLTDQLHCTDDFKVLVVDLGLADLRQNFKAIYGAATVKKLKESGLV